MSPLSSAHNMRLVLTILLSVKSSFKTQASSAHGGAVPVASLRQEDNSWTTRKFNHKFKSLTENELKKVASRTNEALLKSFVDTIMIPRVVGTDGHSRVNAFIIKTMRDMGWVVETDVFENKTPFGVKEFSNVIATLPLKSGASSTGGTSGSGSYLPPRRLAIACHYDSKYYKDIKFLAATDSAVPCAMMLHLASSMHEYLHRPRNRHNDVTLEFLFLDGEEAFVQWTDEDSIYGSRHLAQLWESTRFPAATSSTNRLDSLDFFMLLDLIGEPGPQFHNFFASTSRHFERLMRIEKKMTKAGLMVDGGVYGECRERNGCNRYFPSSVVVNSFIEDDHVPFMQRNVPILHMIPYPFPQGWHNEGDNGQNLHYPTINNLSKIFAAFVAEYLSLPLN